MCIVLARSVGCRDGREDGEVSSAGGIGWLSWCGWESLLGVKPETVLMYVCGEKLLLCSISEEVLVTSFLRGRKHSCSLVRPVCAAKVSMRHVAWA